MKYRVSHVNRQSQKKFGNLIIRSLFGNMLFNNFSLFHAKLLPHEKAPMVRHNKTGEFVYCLKGRFNVTLNKKKFSLKAGNLIWIPAGVWHMFETKSSQAEALAIFTPRLRLSKNPDVEMHPGMSSH